MTANNKRKRERLRYESVVTLIGPNGTASRVISRDINLRGIFVETEKKWDPGTPVEIQLHLNDEPDVQPLSIRGYVTRATPDGLGIKFSELGFDDFLTLQRFIASRRNALERQF